MELTSRQREVLNLIQAGVSKGLPPTLREIMQAIGTKSANGVLCHLKALQKKGYIEVAPNTSRGIQLTERGKLGVPKQSGPCLPTLEDEMEDFGDLFQPGNVVQQLGKRSLVYSAAGDFVGEIERFQS